MVIASQAQQCCQMFPQGCGVSFKPVSEKGAALVTLCLPQFSYEILKISVLEGP